MRKRMKTILAVLGCALIAYGLFGCAASRNQVVNSLGKCKDEEFFTSGGFQDYTDYGKYTFENAQPEESAYFEPLTEERMRDVEGYLDNFENWVEVILRTDPENELIHYDFDQSILSTDDYVYIDADTGHSEYENYNVYIFDTGTQTLFYFHNNI